MSELTSSEFCDRIIASLKKNSADFARRDKILRGYDLSASTQRAIAGLKADELAQLIKEFSRPPKR